MAKVGRGSLGRNVIDNEDIYFDEPQSRKRSSAYQDRFTDRSMHWITFLAAGLGLWIMGIICGFLYFFILRLLFQMKNPHFDPYLAHGVSYIGGRFLSGLLYFGLNPFIILAAFGLAIFPTVFIYTRKKRERLANTGEELLDFAGDSKLATLPELVAKYPVVPNKGAHFKGVDATAIVSHLVFGNQGIKEQRLPVLISGNQKPLEELGSVAKIVEEVNKKTGQRRSKLKEQPVMDPEEGLRMLERLGMRNKKYLKAHDPSKLYVMKEQKVSIADYVNEHWYFEDYETERPSGGYLVDDAPINVVVVAMTRGNKGQSYVNPILDLWSRQEIQPNLLVNDPKGELYTAFYSTLKLRGYETVVFNLLDPAFTDQFNPLAGIITYVRKGYKDEPQKDMTNLADTFFPMPEGTDPIWTQGERMIFIMLAYLLIDFYYEEEQIYLREKMGRVDEGIIQRDLDILWENVTLPNVYRMVTAFSTRKYKELNLKTGEYGKETGINMLEKLFEVTMELPKSNIRELFSNPYANLMSMADSEKMRSSMYGMALTDMSFFVESPIIALTAASPKQSFDLLNMAFPRRFQFRINDELTKDRGWIGQAVRFELYKDPYFKEPYEGKEYVHETRIDKLSWTEMRFEAILPEDVTYVKLQILPRGVRTQGGMVYGTYYAEFVKGYQMDQTRRNFVKDPVTGKYQIKDGVLYMGTLDETGKFNREERPHEYLSNGDLVPVVSLTEVAYNEKPFAVFSVTPPSALTYVKIILMLIHLMFNSSVENSYMSKDNGKPLRKTKYLLDEAGNLSYEGTGINALTTKLSIGLAQGQEFTLILQTLQQVTDIYGEKRDRIISSNTGVTMYLLSSDLDMLNEMSERAGKYHRIRYQNKGFSKTEGMVISQVEDTFSYSMAPVEEPLLSVGRLLQMTNGEALVLSTTKRTDNEGTNVRQQPIFNTKDTSLPMSWYLHRHGYMQRRYSMLTVPTANETITQAESIPPYETLFKRRIQQAHVAPVVIRSYQKELGLSDVEMASAGDDRERRSKEMMHKINMILDYGEQANWDGDKLKNLMKGAESELGSLVNDTAVFEAVENGRKDIESVDKTAMEDKDAIEGQLKRQKDLDEQRAKKYGNNSFSREDIRSPQFETALTKAFEVADVSRLRLPFQRKQVANEIHILYHDQVFARIVSSKEIIKATGEDGANYGSDQAVGWTCLKDVYRDALMENPDWASLFGEAFLTTLKNEFQERKAMKEEGKL